MSSRCSFFLVLGMTVSLLSTAKAEPETGPLFSHYVIGSVDGKTFSSNLLSVCDFGTPAAVTYETQFVLPMLPSHNPGFVPPLRFILAKGLFVVSQITGCPTSSKQTITLTGKFVDNQGATEACVGTMTGKVFMNQIPTQAQLTWTFTGAVNGKRCGLIGRTFTSPLLRP